MSWFRSNDEMLYANEAGEVHLYVSPDPGVGTLLGRLVNMDECDQRTPAFRDLMSAWVEWAEFFSADLEDIRYDDDPDEGIEGHFVAVAPIPSGETEAELLARHAREREGLS